jgi:hypothetical protein
VAKIRPRLKKSPLKTNFLVVRILQNFIKAAQWMLGKLCGLNAIGPMPDRAQRYVANELPTSLDPVESDKNQTLCGRVWIKFRLLVGRILMLVRRYGIPGGVESVVVVTLRDCSI